MSGSYAQAFCGAPAGPEVEAALREVWQRCRARYPEVVVDAASFLAALGERTSHRVDELASLRVADLYLAFACVRGDEVALAVFDALVSRATTLVTRLGDADFQAEAVQLARTRLLLPPAPKLEAYEGRGALLTWLRMVVYREGLMLRRGGAGAEPLEAATEVELVDPGWSAELQSVRALHRGEFAKAFAEAFARLDRTERSVLRMHTVDQLTIDRIGVVYGTHRATAARWLAGARQKLADDIEAQLRARLDLSKAELDRVLGSLQQHLGISLGRLLDEGGAAP